MSLAIKKKLFGSELINNLDSFKKKSEIIISNRFTKDLHDVKDKVFTRDILIQTKK